MALTALVIGASTMLAERNRLVVTLDDGTTKVYDTEQLSKMTFDSVATVNVELKLEAAAGYSLDVAVEKPEDCASYTLAIAKKSDNITDWYSYIVENGVATNTASATTKFGSLMENTGYVVGALATDRYDIPSSITLLDVATVEAQASEKPKVGYVLFDDGTWAQRNQAGKTPIGIIFSVETSEADRSKGYTHGYALALKDAAAKVKWSEQKGECQSGEYTSLTEYGFITDKDGLTHSDHLLAQGTGLYPAADAAAAYAATAPAGSSGWYLPSSGQWYDICVNLGGLSPTMPRLGVAEGYWNGLQDCSNSLSKINAYLGLTGTGNYEPIKVASDDYLWYWTSSESSSEQAYVIFFDNDQLVVEIAGYFKNYDFASNRVRPVIAF